MAVGKLARALWLCFWRNPWLVLLVSHRWRWWWRPLPPPPLRPKRLPHPRGWPRGWPVTALAPPSPPPASSPATEVTVTMETAATAPDTEVMATRAVTTEIDLSAAREVSTLTDTPTQIPATVADMATPHTTPHTELPDTEATDTETPHTGTPDTGTPDTGAPHTGTPDTGIPDTGTPDMETAIITMGTQTRVTTPDMVAVATESATDRPANRKEVQLERKKSTDTLLMRSILLCHLSLYHFRFSCLSNHPIINKRSNFSFHKSTEFRWEWAGERCCHLASVIQVPHTGRGTAHEYGVRKRGRQNPLPSSVGSRYFTHWGNGTAHGSRCGGRRRDRKPCHLASDSDTARDGYALSLWKKMIPPNKNDPIRGIISRLWHDLIHGGNENTDSMRLDWLMADESIEEFESPIHKIEGRFLNWNRIWEEALEQHSSSRASGDVGGLEKIDDATLAPA